MDQFAKETLPVSLEEEMRRSYLDYAMSVIVGRALPDVRDGLKPVHRRVLYAMFETNNVWNRPYVKCARVVGDVLGKYHPHGDNATYEALVRMAQDFSMRYTLIDGQGNFGSIDGDAAAAYRYTECRLDRIAGEMLADIEKETVDFAPNYDGKEQEPSALPTKIPNLLINGSSGIAVGMATNIPPHNLGEVVDACQQLLKKPESSIDELIKLVPAPDFPTAGIIYGVAGVREAYKTGRGRIVMRARTHFEDLKGGRQAIIIDEIPYQVNKQVLLQRIGELVNDKKIDGIAHIQDESDKSGMRAVVELKRDALPEVVLNNLFKQTQLEDTFGVNMVALKDGQPRVLDLKQMLDAFLAHRREVVTRRTAFDLREARKKAHIQEGLAVALSNVDAIIELIKKSQTPAEAKVALMAKAWKSRRRGHAQARRRGCVQARRPRRGVRAAEQRLQAVGRAGAGDPRDAPGAPHRPGAGQDRRRVQGADRHHSRPDGHPREARAHHRDHLRRIEGHQGPVRRQEEERDRRAGRGPADGGPDRRRGRRGDVLARGLHQVAAAHGLPPAAARRPRQAGSDHQGRRFHRAAVHREHARHAAVLLLARAGVLAQGVQRSPGDAHVARQADREPVPALGGRARQRGAPDQGIRRQALRVHGDLARHGEEDAAVAVLQPEGQGHHRGRPRRRRPPHRLGDHRRQARRDALFRCWQGGALR